MVKIRRTELRSRPRGRCEARGACSELKRQAMHLEFSRTEASMISQLKRYGVQILLKAGHTEADTARLAEVSLRTVRRVAEEPDVEHVDDTGERARRRIGRPSPPSSPSRP
jgi:hypothetical protein